MPATKSLIERFFPDPDPIVARKVMECAKKKPKLTLKVRHLSLIGILLLVLIGTGLMVEFSIAFGFNDRLIVGNLHEALSTSEQFLRGFAALGMMLVVMGVTFSFHVAVSKSTPVPKRIMAGVAAIIVGFGIYIISGSIGHQVFSSLLSQLWEGAKESPSFALDSDPAAATRSFDEQVPFWLRLIASSSLFVGVAIFVAVCELAWLSTRESLLRVRLILAETELVLAKSAASAHAKEQAIALERELSLFSDLQYRKNFVHTKTAAGQQSWRSTIESKRSDTTNIASLSPEEYKKRRASDIRIDDAIAKVDALEANTDNLRSLLDELFATEPIRKATEPQQLSRRAAPVGDEA